MKKHKWHDEIVAWASGAEIEVRISDSNHAYVWTDCETPMFDTNEKWEYRIKPQTKCIVKDCMNHTNEGRFVGELCAPCWDYITNGNGVHSQAYRNAQPKESQYLYAYYLMQKPEVFLFDRPQIIQRGDKFLGKIKLEDE